MWFERSFTNHTILKGKRLQFPKKFLNLTFPKPWGTHGQVPAHKLNRGDVMENCKGGPGAVACLRGGAELPELKGTVKFYRRKCGSLVTAEVSGLPRSQTGFFAFHIHEGGDCGGEGFSDTGGHLNPTEAAHPEHQGDLPPLLSSHGSAFLSVWTDRFRVEDVIGRTVIIHGQPDDFHTQPSGNAGTKIACGVIRRA